MVRLLTIVFNVPFILRNTKRSEADNNASNCVL